MPFLTVLSLLLLTPASCLLLSETQTVSSILLLVCIYYLCYHPLPLLPLRQLQSLLTHRFPYTHSFERDAILPISLYTIQRQVFYFILY
ncbi:hypothetical protein B9Z19DRAFT_336145 [Tuber borchii]|uniref:Secreted peptide n=1 Tax=Tuber borchii TaxID=42251 RepID=A0A2T6ZJA5_TUBBO|nr:hypothetical protein B9Z19DRAFT_336145 [Tuber borchii]